MRIVLARHSRLQRAHLGGQYSSFSEQSAQMEWHRKVILLHIRFRRYKVPDDDKVRSIWRWWLNYSRHTLRRNKKKKQRIYYYFHAIKCIINSIDTVYVHLKRKNAPNYHSYYLLTPENSDHAPYSIRWAVQRQRLQFLFHFFRLFLEFSDIEFNQRLYYYYIESDGDKRQVKILLFQFIKFFFAY